MTAQVPEFADIAQQTELHENPIALAIINELQLNGFFGSLSSQMAKQNFINGLITYLKADLKVVDSSSLAIIQFRWNRLDPVLKLMKVSSLKKAINQKKAEYRAKYEKRNGRQLDLYFDHTTGKSLVKGENITILEAAMLGYGLKLKKIEG